MNKNLLTWVILITVTVLSACSGSKKTTGADPLNGTWDLNYISGPRITFEGLYPDKKPYLTFDVANKRFTGNTSCNSLNAAYTSEGNNITFLDGATTMMACPGQGESTFLSMLKKVNRYAVSEGNTLNLLIDDVAVMRFTKRTK